MTHTKDEALALALEALDNLLYWDNGKPEYDEARASITAIKQAIADSALDRMAENAKELVLMPLRGGDYEPAQQSRSDVEPVAWVVEDEHGERLEWAGDAHSCHGLPTLPLYTNPPAAQRQWVGLTDEEIDVLHREVKVQLMGTFDTKDIYRAIEAKLKEKNT
jgi:hypothetical protein